MIRSWVLIAFTLNFAASFTTGWVDVNSICLHQPNKQNSLSSSRLLQSFVSPMLNPANNFLLASTRQKSVRLYMSGSQQEPDDDRVLFVGNLPWVVDSYGLKKLFEKFGPIFNAQVIIFDSLLLNSVFDVFLPS